MSAHVIDRTSPIHIEYQRLPDTGETRLVVFHEGDSFPFTVSNGNFLKLIDFYRHHFDTVDVAEVAL